MKSKEEVGAKATKMFQTRSIGKNRNRKIISNDERARG
jgi:hypothetical protein